MTNSQKVRKAALSRGDGSPHEAGNRGSDSSDLEISPAQWGSFVESFTRQHEGWLANISVNHGPKQHIETGICRLHRIAIDREDEKCWVRISMVDDRGELMIHSIPDPSHITFKRNPTGAHEGLQITSADGKVTYLRFRVAALPETLDGVLPATNYSR